MRIRLLTAILASLLVLTATGIAAAKPAFLVTLTATYPTHSSFLTQQGCTNCHTTVGDFSRNAYGKELESLIKASGGQDLTAAMLKQAESASPTPNSATYGALINSEKDLTTIEPAAATAAPATTTRTTANTPAAPMPAAAPAAKPTFPTNFEHPAIVHFPIALFISGLFLDALGFFRKEKFLLMAGWYDLILAAISSLGAVATGLGALILMQLPLIGIIRLHMLLALVSTVLMWSLVGLRAYKHERISTPGRLAYYVIAAANLVIISVVGHLGGQFVYGN